MPPKLKDGETTALVKGLVDEVMREFHEPWPEDIIDRVFVAIEHNSRYLARYRELLAITSGKYAVNTTIGRVVKDQTGLENVEFPCTPRSSLITAYSRLGHRR